ncbi:MAG TPA: DUF3037 domain-containing protein [Flavisolibacter sp.]|jgi:hypothetical protein|nr:DUF3037 domain-containing protein [Flavisolibacter sp.]
MPEKRLFEYAVVRVVPRVEREEFLNVGIILYCRQAKFLAFRYQLDNEKLAVLCPATDCTEVDDHLKSFDKICTGGKEAGAIGNLDLPSRFRWLTATRSTIVQTSKVHPGFCVSPEETIQKLFRQLVL